MQWMGGAFLGAAALSGGGWTYISHIETGWVETVSVNLSLPRLSPAFNGFRLAQISDIHLSPSMTAEQVAEVVKSILAFQPDLVAITGDFVDKDFEIRLSVAGLVDALRPLSEQAQVVAVLGNHDYTTNPTAVRKILKESGILELYNDVLPLSAGKESLYICGVDDLLEGQSRLSRVIEKIPGEAGAAILLAHEPDFADSTVLARRFDLQLSGHTHGGQVVMPLYGPIVLPKYGEKYPSGLYQIGDLQLYTNRGLGTVPPRIRFNCRPELTLFTLSTSGHAENG